MHEGLQSSIIMSLPTPLPQDERLRKILAIRRRGLIAELDEIEDVLGLRRSTGPTPHQRAAPLLIEDAPDPTVQAHRRVFLVRRRGLMQELNCIEDELGMPRSVLPREMRRAREVASDILHEIPSHGSPPRAWGE